MKTQFDKIYVISLITNKDRQEFIKYQMNELDIDFEFIYGVDFYNLKYDISGNEINYPNLIFDYTNLNNNTMFGCTISHYKAILQAYYLNYNNVLIIEDDMCFNKDYNLLYDMLNNIPKDADFVTYDPRSNKKDIILSILENIKLNKNNRYFKSNIDTFGAACFALMNRSTMELYINQQHNLLQMSDHVIYFYENTHNAPINKYISTNCIIIDQLTHNKNIEKNLDIFLNKEFDGYDNLYSLDLSFDKDNFFKPNTFHEHSRLC